MPGFNHWRIMNKDIGRIIVAIARGIAWVIEQIIKGKNSL